MERLPCVYILASGKFGTLYTGVTTDLIKRVWEHRNKFVPGFTAQYGVSQLVYYERHETMENAIHREKRIKEWRRAWKVKLILRHNPDWRDLWHEITQDGSRPAPG